MAELPEGTPGSAGGRRPGSTGQAAASEGGYTGVETVLQTPSAPANEGDASVMGEVAEDVMNSMVDQLLEMCEQGQPLSEAALLTGGPPDAGLQGGSGSWPPEAAARVAKQQSAIEQLQAELASTKNELDFFSLEREEQLKKHEEAAKLTQALEGHVEELQQKFDAVRQEKLSAQRELDEERARQAEQRSENETLRQGLNWVKQQLETRGEAAASQTMAPAAAAQTESSLRGQLELLQARVKSLGEEVRLAREQEEQQAQAAAAAAAAASQAATPGPGAAGDPVATDSAAAGAGGEQPPVGATGAGGSGEQQQQAQPPAAASQQPAGGSQMGSVELSEGLQQHNASYQLALQAAYQQISQLNTQLAHLYTELTVARTELSTARAEQDARSDAAAMGMGAAGTGAGAGAGAAGPETSGGYAAGGVVGAGGEDPAVQEVEKRNGQIADLVSDIRHLQLDLEYHQQKLDQLIDEKAAMTEELRRRERELRECRQLLEEKDQLSRHKEIDLQRSRANSRSQSPSTGRAGLEMQAQSEQTSALRGEVARKDGALILSHYDLHKEKLVRDRLEQKNMKLMERLQKLMMVVETQRKEQERSEKRLMIGETVCEDKDRQLAEITTKAKQLQRVLKQQQMKRMRQEQQQGSRPVSQGPEAPAGGGVQGVQRGRQPNQESTILPNLAGGAARGAGAPGGAVLEPVDPIFGSSSVESATGTGAPIPRKPPMSPSSIYGGRKRLGY